MRVKDIEISRVIDSDGDIFLSVVNESISATEYISKDDALKIIEHLTNVFEIDEEVVPEMFPGTNDLLSKLTVK